MQVLIFMVYISSVCIQIFTFFSFRKTFTTYQRIWLGNLIFSLGISSTLILHVYSYYKDSYAESVTIAGSLFMLANSIIFFIIIFSIGHIIKNFGRKQQKLIYKLKYDTLTRALSRDEIITKCEREIARAIRVGEKASLLMIDMDHFKEINDTYGHAIGDEVLLRSTNYCKEILREVDLIGRVGGDEFIILLSNTNLESAKEVADRIQLKMKNLINELSIKTAKPISLSIGITCYNPTEYVSNSKANDPKEILKLLIDSSDSALYDAKKYGRNQCSLANETKLKFKMEQCVPL
jgi:diguanylate cyclase (GGDEF)-like protein